MYIDPSLGGPLLEPLFRLQASSKYTIPYAAADLGAFSIKMNVGRLYLDTCFRIILPQCVNQQFEPQSGR